MQRLLFRSYSLSTACSWLATVTIMDEMDCVYVCLSVFKMSQLIKTPTNCEIRSVICYLNEKDLKVAEIHRQNKVEVLLLLTHVANYSQDPIA